MEEQMELFSTPGPTAEDVVAAYVGSYPDDDRQPSAILIRQVGGNHYAVKTHFPDDDVGIVGSFYV